MSLSGILSGPSGWSLIEFGNGAGPHRTINIPLNESIVGRGKEAAICLPLTSVSKQHARLFVHANQLFVEDLDSTNGTYVNGHRTKSSALVEGDLVQFANVLFKVAQRALTDGDGTREEGLITWAQALLTFDRLLTERRVIPFYQPIVRMADRQAIDAYEVLARSDLPELGHPAAMFGAAERLGQQAALSELMRSEGIRIGLLNGPTGTRYFLNTHPAEVVTDRFLGSLRDLRCDYPDAAVTIEIHEAAVTSPDLMQQLRSTLKSLDMELSYDDFGAGQGRLVELGEVPPEVLKFDMQLIRGIDHAAASRQEVLRALVRIAVDLGTTPLAEGVETEAEHEVCQQMGFELGQGYLYGRPAPFKAAVVMDAR